MQFNKTLSVISISFFLLGCSIPNGQKSNSDKKSEINEVAIPSPAENSDHGYLLADNRIPRLENCKTWKEFWIFGGPAISFEVAAKSDHIKNLATSTQIYLKNKHLDFDTNGILCDEEDKNNNEAVTEKFSETENVYRNAIEDIRSFRSSGIDGLEIDAYKGSGVRVDTFNHYLGTVERAAEFWAQFNGGSNVVKSVSVLNNQARKDFESRRKQIGLPNFGEDWWKRSEEFGGGTVISDTQGLSHVWFRLKPGEPDLPSDDYAFHEVTHSYQDVLSNGNLGKDVPCWFVEGYAMVVGLANSFDDEARNIEFYEFSRTERIKILNNYYDQFGINSDSELKKNILFKHTHIQCNTNEPLFGYRLGMLVSEAWISEFGFSASVEFIKSIQDGNFEENFESEFGISMDEWLTTKAFDYVKKSLSAP